MFVRVFSQIIKPCSIFDLFSFTSISDVIGKNTMATISSPQTISKRPKIQNVTINKQMFNCSDVISPPSSDHIVCF